MSFKQIIRMFQKCFILFFGMLFSCYSFTQDPSLILKSPLYAFEESADNINPSDAYDPFMDYTVFERTEAERNDIRFFKQGRLLTLSALLGAKLFTGSMAQQVQPHVNFGMQVSMFFNLHFAGQIYGLFSYHPFGFRHEQAIDIDGFMEFYGTGVDLKYYIDREKIIKPIAVLNPYALIGFSAVKRNIAAVGARNIGSIGYGFRSGGGIEVNISETVFLGLHGDFNFINFVEEWEEWELPSKTNQDASVRTGVFTYGDIINILFVAGINY